MAPTGAKMLVVDTFRREPIGIGEASGVAAGSREQKDDGCPLGDGDTGKTLTHRPQSLGA
jgi:hypothetical protein